MPSRSKTLSNVGATYEQMDKIMQMQGFRRFRPHAPVYQLQMKDFVSGQVYRLSLPTKQYRPRTQ